MHSFVVGDHVRLVVIEDAPALFLAFEQESRNAAAKNLNLEKVNVAKGQESFLTKLMGMTIKRPVECLFRQADPLSASIGNGIAVEHRVFATDGELKASFICVDPHSRLGRVQALRF